MSAFEEVVFYIPYVARGCVEVRKHRRKFYYSQFPEEHIASIKERSNLTEEAARAAIEPHIYEAERRAGALIEDLIALQKKYACEIDYVMRGDVHGIYEDYLCVDFSMAGYDFNYEIPFD